MKLIDLVQNTNQLVEAKFTAVGDKVNKLIQSQLWPIVKQLELQTKSGTVLRRDKDGAVLAQIKAKSLELIDMYGGANKERHKEIVNDATNYQEVLKLMTNVLMYNLGQGVIKESILNEVYLGYPYKPFAHVTKPLDVVEYTVTNVTSREITLVVELTDLSIEIDNLTPITEECCTVKLLLTGDFFPADDEFEWHGDIVKTDHRRDVQECSRVAEEFYNKFMSKYQNVNNVMRLLKIDDRYFAAYTNKELEQDRYEDPDVY